MYKKIAITHKKGGVGKTTTAVNDVEVNSIISAIKSHDIDSLIALMDTWCILSSALMKSSAIARQVRCAVSGIFLDKDDVYCHHKVSRHLGGKDNYKNLIIVSEVINKLIHANCENTILRLLTSSNLNQAQIKKLNLLQKLAVVENCFVIPDGTPCERKLSCTV